MKNSPFFKKVVNNITKFVLVFVLLISQINFAQIQNNATIHVADNSSLYIGSGDFNLGENSITSTSRTTNVFGTIVFADGSSTNGASNNQFIGGYVETVSSSPFIMDIGENGELAPLLIDASSTAGVKGAFYDDVPVDISSLGINLVTVSGVSYWDLQGAANAIISLSWRNNTIEDGYSLADYSIVGYDGTSWVIIDSTVDFTSFLGSISTTTSGSITSNNVISLSDYEAFTIGIRDNCTTLAVSSGNTKTWNGSWSPSPPTDADPVVINTLYANGSFSCNSLVLNANIELSDGQFVNCVNGVTGVAKIIMSSEASFVQLNSVSDAPKIELTKATRDVLRRFDYIYWGTPIEGNFFDQIASAQASTSLLPNAFDNKFQYQSGPSGGWQVLEATTTGRGFITRVRNQAPFINPTANDFINMDFDGIANNGNITVAIDQDPAVPNGGRSHNLLANPYPSAIDGNRFVEENTNIDGAIYLWTAANPISDGDYSQADYLVFTRMGVTYPTDFIATFDGKIASGQGFLVKALAEDETVTFTNCMRLDADNTSFFKTNSVIETTSEESINRFKLNLTGENGVFNQILIGYSSEATLGYDRMYDATSNSASTAQIFSILDNSNLRLSINARPEFEINDVVPIGIRKNNSNEESFTISLAEQEGIFSFETILVFLHDKQILTTICRSHLFQSQQVNRAYSTGLKYCIMTCF
ncbi:hypothetical protein [Yeosuana sp.]|uniref:hypothetical protein n=1 Tax=Yeosuana sp. TaxID=2529388 RepID=UPI00404A9103